MFYFFLKVVVIYLFSIVLVLADDNVVSQNQEITITENSEKIEESHTEIIEKTPIIEGKVGAGFIGFEPMFLDKSLTSFSDVYMPYGKLHLRFDDNKFLRPEFLIEESGAFKFNKSGIKTGKSPWAYNKYYLKIPTGIPLPFFKFVGRLYIDGLYSSSNINILLDKPIVVNNVLQASGTRLTGISSEMTFRLYLDTPIVKNSSIFEYSYFGVYYSEKVSPRTAKPPSIMADAPEILLSTLIRSGGIFYDMKKDTPLKGLSFAINAYIGYGDLYPLDDVSSVPNSSFGNINGLIAVGGQGGFSYRYVFNNGLGIEIDTGVSFFATTEFINSPDKNKYTMNMGGDLRYFANLSFVFGY